MLQLSYEKVSTSDELTVFVEACNRNVFNMLNNSDTYEKKGGILAIISLTGLDIINLTQLNRFVYYLRSALPCNDQEITFLIAKALGKLALALGPNTAEFVDFEVRRVLEWVGLERNESKRYAAVLILRALAVSTPTLFYIQVQKFFDAIFVATRDSKPLIREGAISALRAALVLTAQRETKVTHKPPYYSQCYEEFARGFDDVPNREKGGNRDDRIHGSLLILNELLRCSNVESETERQELEELNESQFRHYKLRDFGTTHRNLKLATSQHHRHQQHHHHLFYELQQTHSDSLSAFLSSKVIDYNRQPLFESNTSKILISEKFSDICTLVLKQKNSRSSYVQQALLVIIPRLASFQTKVFVNKYLNETLTLLLTHKRERDRSNSFRAIGLLAIAVKEKIKPHIPVIMEIIKALLPSRETSVNPALTAALQEIAKEIPDLKWDIQEGLLRMLSCILRNQPLRHPGMPKHLAMNQSVPPPLQILIENNDVHGISLALQTLGNFDFQGHSLMQFVRYCANNFLSHECKEIRMEAVKTCSYLLIPALQKTSKQLDYSQTMTQTIAEVIGKLLIVGITDTDSDVRYCVLASFDNNFNDHLSRAENLNILFSAMNDEVFEIRELAICIIGRLSSLNPAYILTELEHSGIGRNKERSGKMLGHLVSNAPCLIQLYVEPIMKVLIPKLKDSPAVVVCSLACIGELAQVNGTEMCKWMPKLLSIIIEMLQDASSLYKREISLWTLGQLVGKTGYVVAPYQEFPQLLDILLNFLKTEQSSNIRREAIRVLGLLGALDPYKHKVNLGVVDRTGQSVSVVSICESKSEQQDSNQDLSTSEMLVNMSSNTLDEYYPAIVISTLMKILRDSSLTDNHNMVVQAVSFIFKSLGIRCVPFIHQFLFQQLGVLISIFKQHIRSYLDEIFQIIKHYWKTNNSMQSTLISLIERIVVALGAEFQVYLPLLIPNILRVFMLDTERTVTTKLLNALQKFGSNLDEYLPLILPPVIKLFDSSDVPIQVRKLALETIDELSISLDFTEFSSRIIHPLVRTLDNCPELQQVCMNTLAALVGQLGKKYQIFIPMVNKVMQKHRITHQRYDLLITRIIKGTTVAEEEDDPIFFQRRQNQQSITDDSESVTADIPTIKKLQMTATNVLAAWNIEFRRISREDWLEWFRRLSINILKESPSPALRSCWALGQHYNQVPKDLFNAAFVSCWEELSESQQKDLVESIKKALIHQNIPEIIQILLNLAEFMEHCDKGPLPLDEKLLGEKAITCRAYAKALHYKEEEFHKNPSVDVLEDLISVNNKLQQPEASVGILEYAKKNFTDAEWKKKDMWYEKLHEWQAALDAYQKNAEQQPDCIDVILGQMRCLEALGEWGQLNSLACEKWSLVDDVVKQKMAGMAASAAWGLEKWSKMKTYTTMLPRDTHDGAFYRAVLAIHQNEYQVAQLHIDQARDMMDTELTAMAGESYNRAYPAMVSVQMLAELEEVIQYKLVEERRNVTRQMWWERLQGCQQVVEDWQKFIQIHSLVITPQQDMRSWLKFASLCRKNGRLVLSRKTLSKLLGVDPQSQPNEHLPSVNPQVIFNYTKHMWDSDNKENAFKELSHLIKETLSSKCVQLAENVPQKDELNKLLAKCYLKQGQWQEVLQGINENSILQIRECYERSKNLDSEWYKAWHRWAYVNFQAVLFYKRKFNSFDNNEQPKTESETLPSESQLSSQSLFPPQYTEFAVLAVKGFIRSINLSSGNSLQDTLRLLTLWFDYGQYPEVNEALDDGIDTIQIDNWLQVIPQLIARIDTKKTLVGRLIQHVLMTIGKHHPQALIYPLTVASKSNVTPRKEAAEKVFKNMSDHSSVLVNQAALVLEEASRMYFNENDPDGMIAALTPLHAMMERGAETSNEIAFNQAYHRDLLDAQNHCRNYLRTRNLKEMSQAWDLYYHMFRRISKQLHQFSLLELQYISPKLLMCRSLELAVPGTYNPNQSIVHIQQVQNSLQVITSKQRPRKLVMKGSNGKDFMFLLKGHEDLRQDERVMQLFGLVNTLLINDPETFRRNLTIQRFSVIPLSTNSGLIGWVPHCDTLHTLIRDYREKKKILLNIEHRIMLRSPSSEVWFDRRTNYTRSLAVMSIVGYVLGLGDRHPSNLMLERTSGKITHIDFGDCFEVAMTREKFPEKIPFRLTRMLINAMEVTGIEGTYRMTCERVMRVLRHNKDSLMAVLEAFVYDPLLNWRLVESKQHGTTENSPDMYIEKEWLMDS
ncbi:Serine/threonine-protein kinase mTOR [Nymphon striatum]|nr:Serine/threonine-protein kinase mTOR [Nymphon striatum]